MLNATRPRWPWLRHIFADGGCAGDKLSAALAGKGRRTPKIIKRSGTAGGFEVLPRRWVVERIFAWLGRCRRLAKDWERTAAEPKSRPCHLNEEVFAALAGAPAVIARWHHDCDTARPHPAHGGMTPSREEPDTPGLI